MNELKLDESSFPFAPDGQEDASGSDAIFGSPGPRSRPSLLRQASTATRIGAAQALQDRKTFSDELARTVLAAKGMDHLEQELQDFQLNDTMREQVGEIFQCVKELGIKDPVPIVNQLTQIFLRQDLKNELSDLRAELENELRQLEQQSAGIQLASELAKIRAKQRPIVDRFMSVARTLHTEVHYKNAFGTLMKTPSKRRSAAQEPQPSGGSRQTGAKATKDRARWRQLRTQREIAERLRRDRPAQPHELEPGKVPTKPTDETSIAKATPLIQRSGSAATAASGEADELSENSPKLVASQPDWEEDDWDVKALKEQEEIGDEAAGTKTSSFRPSSPANDSEDESRFSICSRDDGRGSDDEHSEQPLRMHFKVQEDEEDAEEGETETEDDEEEDEQEKRRRQGQEDARDQHAVQAALNAAVVKRRPPAKRKKQKTPETLLPKHLYPKKSYDMAATVSGSSSSWKRPAAATLTSSGYINTGRLRFPPLPCIQPAIDECFSVRMRRKMKRAQGAIDLETIQLHWDSDLHFARRQIEVAPLPKLPWLEEQQAPRLVFGRPDTSHRAAECTATEALARDAGHSSRLRDGDGRGQQHSDGHYSTRPRGMFKKLVVVKDEGLSPIGFSNFHRSLRL